MFNEIESSEIIIAIAPQIRFGHVDILSDFFIIIPVLVYSGYLCMFNYYSCIPAEGVTYY